ncbi:GNAT family acetyltransferase [Aliiruegeria haliotis]|uniref:GNAT family acetyltransferase n=1 Tax=Aliiruegeria haliotis TaxID=1280846 RepID=A0A2T0RXQ2_9RHOB|nr:GNAT family N-acetyltransferase [Aliiruegeria haliotis]PRY25951.1 GNAT family acetyltransferase [Aliiruegeria haliotis]
MTWTVRRGGAADVEACHDVYYDAVRNGTSPHYSAEQAAAWAPSRKPEDWLEPRLAVGTTWIAESVDRAEGFLTVTDAGHLDFFFVRPQWRRSGLSSALYDQMQAWTDARGLTHLTTYASHLCRRFLERRGWVVLHGETALRNGVELTRWEMAKGRPEP